MKIKNIFVSIFIISLLILTTGCGTKKVINKDKLIEISKKEKLSLYNISDKYKKDKNIKTGSVVISLRGWRLEFYELKSSDSAEDMYDENKKIFEKEKTEDATEISSNWRNYDTYTLTTSLKYYYLCRVENTLLYVKVDLTHKKDVKKFIDKLGY